MLFDAHTHWYPQDMSLAPSSWAAQNGELHWGALMGMRPDLKPSLQSFPSIDDFLRKMDEAQVERAAIQGWYFLRLESCRHWNLQTAKAIEKHRDRLSALASLNCAEKGFEKVLREAFDMGFSGVGELHDGVQGFGFDTPEFDELCRFCGEHGWCVSLHLSDFRTKDYPNKVLTRNSSAYEAARRNGKTKFLFAHFGGGDVFEQNFSPPSNVYYDCAANTFLYGFKAYEKLPESVLKKIAFGSDYPLRLYPRKFKVAEMREFAKENLAAIPQDFIESFSCGNFRNLIALP